MHRIITGFEPDKSTTQHSEQKGLKGANFPDKISILNRNKGGYDYPSKGGDEYGAEGDEAIGRRGDRATGR